MSVEKRNDQRAAKRHAYNVSAELIYNERRIEAETKNISDGGAAIESRLEFERGTTFKISFFFLVDGIEDPDRDPFEAEVEVRWCAEAERDGYWKSGLQFRELSLSTKTQLLDFIAQIE